MSPLIDTRAWITFWTPATDVGGSFLLGEGSAKVTGYSGWEEVARPKRKGFADWSGSPLLRMSIPLLLDGWLTGLSVNDGIVRLEALTGVAGKRPPTFTLRAAPGVRPVPHMDRTWVVEDLEWADDTIRRDDGRVLRQSVTVSLLEYRAADIARPNAPKRTYKVTGNRETFHSVAKKEGVSWTVLRDANRSAQDGRYLRKGATLKLPSR